MGQRAPESLERNFRMGSSEVCLGSAWLLCLQLWLPCVSFPLRFLICYFNNFVAQMHTLSTWASPTVSMLRASLFRVTLTRNSIGLSHKCNMVTPKFTIVLVIPPCFRAHCALDLPPPMWSHPWLLPAPLLYCHTHSIIWTLGDSLLHPPLHFHSSGTFSLRSTCSNSQTSSNFLGPPCVQEEAI